MTRIIDNIIGAAGIGATILANPLLRPFYSVWGTTEQERTMKLPGDELIPNAKISHTRAVTVSALAQDIYPWLVQIGADKAGFYSYEYLENLVGCNIKNADTIHDEWQDIKVGDKVYFGPESYPFNSVYDFEPNEYLLLYDFGTPEGEDIDDDELNPANWVEVSWLFYLKWLPEGQTRLITRWRVNYSPTMSNRVLWRSFTEPVNFVMERKMLLSIKKIAEDHRFEKP